MIAEGVRERYIQEGSERVLLLLLLFCAFSVQRSCERNEALYISRKHIDYPNQFGFKKLLIKE